MLPGLYLGGKGFVFTLPIQNMPNLFLLGMKLLTSTKDSKKSFCSVKNVDFEKGY